MRIFRYTLILCGNKLNSSVLADKLRGEYVIYDRETIGSIADDWGAMSISPLMEAVVDDNYDQVNVYHAWFASFLEANQSVFTECGADDIRVFMEVFYAEGQQCNLEIFDREVISRIGKFNVALPISVYALSENAITKWAEEIEQNWRGVTTA